MVGNSKISVLITTGVITCAISSLVFAPKVSADEMRHNYKIVTQPVINPKDSLNKFSEGQVLPNSMVNDDIILATYKQEVKTQQIIDKSRGWQAPVQASLTSTFGPRVHPISGKYEKAHGALDLAAPQGTPIHASKSGKIISAGWLGGYGNQVVIDHGDGYYSRYGHMEKILVSEGQKVEQAETIGLMGSTGNSTGPHVHFEIMHGGTQHCYRIDPAQFLKFENGKTVYWNVLTVPK